MYYVRSACHYKAICIIYYFNYRLVQIHVSCYIYRACMHSLCKDSYVGYRFNSFEGTRCKAVLERNVHRKYTT